MLALLAFAVLAPLLYVPGALIARSVSGPSGATLETIYARVVLGALLNGWLAFTLGQLGIFSAWLHLALVLLVCIIAAAVIRRREPHAFTLRLILQSARQAARTACRLPGCAGNAYGVQPTPRLRLRERLRRPAFSLLVVLVVFGLLVARPFEVVIGVRDAGVYANAGFAMARTGGLVQHDALLAQLAADKRSPDAELAAAAAQAETNFLGVQNPQRFIATRLRAAGFFVYQGDLDAGRVTPQGLHLFTAWIGLLTGLLGPHAGLLAPGLMGLLGVWSVAMLGRRIRGPWVGVLAGLLLALNAVQVWFSRYSTTETTAQFLTFAGLYFFACMTDDSHPSSRIPRPASLSALLAGLAFGQLALARIDFFLVLAPALLYLLYRWVARRWSMRYTLFAAALGAMLLHAVVQFTSLARAYFFDTLYARLQDYALTALLTLPFLTPALRQTFLQRPCSPLTLQPCPPIDGMPPTSDAPFNIARIAGELGALLLLILALAALRRWGQPLLRRIEAALRRAAGPLLGLAALATLLFGAYAYLVRPQILTAQTLAALPGCLAPTQLRSPQGDCLALQGYVGAPITAPGYVDPVAATLGAIPQLLRGQQTPLPDSCAALRDPLLPASAKGLTVAELIEDKLLDQTAISAATLSTLRACDRLVLRTQFANSQANLVRVGWYTSPLGIVLGFVGLALLWRRLTPGVFLVLAVTLITGFTFVRLTYGTSDQHYVYILRRYVPQVYPALALATAVAILELSSRTSDWLARTSKIQNPKIGLAITLAVVSALVAFLVVTGLPIFRHTEYGGALSQIEGVAARFGPSDVLLLRGGAPSYAESRDLPDVLATPLTNAFGISALTVKSRDPGRYAVQLTRYVREWQARGRQVYLAAGPSGALQLPGMALEPVGSIVLSLDEFEQLTNQKPRNVQNFQVAFALYRVVPATAAPPPAASLGPTDYASQLGGLYRAEQISGQTLAWTDGVALLRADLPPGAAPNSLTLQLAGGTRPATLGSARACISLATIIGSWSSEAQPPFAPPQCVTLTERAGSYTVTVPAELLASRPDALLVRIESPTWIPARDDPHGRDPRRLGVQFGGLQLLP